MLEINRNLAIAGFLLIQPFTEDPVEVFYTMHSYQERDPIKTSSGTASILIERICDNEANGSIEISLWNGDLDPKIGTLELEAHPLTERSISANVVASVVLQSPDEIARISLEKDQAFMIFLKERIGSIVRTLREFDVAHYCVARIRQEPANYNYSDDFQPQPTRQL